MRNYFLLLFFLLFYVSAESKQIPERPSPPRLVNDYAGILTTAQMDALERKLVAYDDSTSTQIAIVIEGSLEGEEIFDYSNRLAQAWGIGRKGEDNGVLLYVAISDRKVFIQTGYGVEGFLPDALAKRIVENVIVPAFRQQNYFEGLDRATTIIMQLGSGEYDNDQMNDGGGSRRGIPWRLIFFIAFFLLISFSNRGGGGGYSSRGRYGSGGGWMIFGPGLGGGHSSSGGGGGFGGGGFGGFGGGGFGGGGAGGSW